MAKQGEIDYLKHIGPEGVWHAANKPFSDPNCAGYLMGIAAIRSLLPPPPARLLDLGCGTGWTSIFFAKMGYEVVGVDIAADMIHCAQDLKQREGLENIDFAVSDYEHLGYESEFDCAVFYDALHHAVDESLAVKAAFTALKPGGVCVTSEPGKGHARHPASVRAIEEFGVTEKDMPPAKIISLGRAAGFRAFNIYPGATTTQAAMYGRAVNEKLSRLVRKVVMRHAFLLAAFVLKRHLGGIVTMQK